MATDDARPKGPGAAEVEGDLVREIEGVVDGLVPRAARGEAAELVGRLERIVDTLILRGHLKPQHRRLLNRVRPDRTSVLLAMLPDKRAIAGPDIDCASLIHLCKARCCSYNVTLSPEDIAERQLQWELYEPYRLLRDHTTGYCRYMKADAGCGVYADRPATCRLYDCRDDPRVWLDWERKIPVPMETGAERGVIPWGEWPAQQGDGSKTDDGV